MENSRSSGSLENSPAKPVPTNGVAGELDSIAESLIDLSPKECGGRLDKQEPKIKPRQAPVKESAENGSSPPKCCCMHKFVFVDLLATYFFQVA